MLAGGVVPVLAGGVVVPVLAGGVVVPVLAGGVPAVEPAVEASVAGVPSSLLPQPIMPTVKIAPKTSAPKSFFISTS